MGLLEGKEGKSRYTSRKLGIAHNSLACDPKVMSVSNRNSIANNCPEASGSQISTRDRSIAQHHCTGLVLFVLLLCVTPHSSVRSTFHICFKPLLMFWSIKVVTHSCVLES